MLGSNGSVVPLFREQIARGGPVTVTHPEVTRYFMTIPEAVQLILQAAAIGDGGEIFVLEMGEPVRIVDLARQMIRLSGFEPDDDIEIVFTGLRPGEKLHEELMAEDEEVAPTPHERIRVLHKSGSPSRPEAWLATIESAIRAGESRAALELLQELVPGYRPSATALPGAESGAPGSGRARSARRRSRPEPAFAAAGDRRPRTSSDAHFAALTSRRRVRPSAAPPVHGPSGGRSDAGGDPSAAGPELAPPSTFPRAAVSSAALATWATSVTRSPSRRTTVTFPFT